MMNLNEEFKRQFVCTFDLVELEFNLFVSELSLNFNLITILILLRVRSNFKDKSYF